MKAFNMNWLLFIAVIILSTVCLAVPAYFIYQNAKGLIIDELGKNASNIASTAASFIEKDIESFSVLPAFSYNSTDDPGFLGAAFDPEIDITVHDDYYGENSDAVYDATYDATHDATYDATYDAAQGVYNNEVYVFDYYDFYYDSEYYSVYDKTYNEVYKRVYDEVYYGTQDNSEAKNNDEYFEEILGLLEKIEEETEAENIYTEKRVSDTQKAYIFDIEEAPEERYFSNSLTDAELLAFNEGIRTFTDVMHDNTLGEYISGYSPIVDLKTGKTVGMVVVEFTLEYAQNVLGSIVWIIFGSFFVIMVLVSFVVLRLIKSRIIYRSKDDLTELCNKRFFNKHIKKAVYASQQNGCPLSLIMIDVDRFKDINDKLGHIAGDNVLKSISQSMLSCTRSSDICTRYGGDEFAITLPKTDSIQAAQIAERIRSEASNIVLYPGNSEHIKVTLSIGIAEWSSGMNVMALIDCADKAMYISKNFGKNRITVYGSQDISEIANEYGA